MGASVSFGHISSNKESKNDEKYIKSFAGKVSNA